jgi:hypothetical protein
MSSDDEDGDLLTSNNSPLSAKLEKLYDELTDLTSRTYRIYKIAKQMRKEDLYSTPFTLKPSAAKYFEKEKMSVEEILNLWIPVWKSEDRLGVSGKTIRLPQKEATLLHMSAEEPVNVYDLCKRIVTLFQSGETH